MRQINLNVANQADSTRVPQHQSDKKQFLDNKETRTSPGVDASVDMSVTSDATFQFGRHMGKF
jgi:hypothetical protein